jgi:uncharacterized protein (TIGR00251 family)
MKMNDTDITKYINGKRLSIIVKPNSNKTCVTNWDDDKQALRVDIAAPPEDNKANIEVVKFFSRLLKKQVRILTGMTSKHKILQID